MVRCIQYAVVNAEFDIFVTCEMKIQQNSNVPNLQNLLYAISLQLHKGQRVLQLFPSVTSFVLHRSTR
jgi:hypothetical protein